MHARVNLHNTLLQRIKDGTLSAWTRWKKTIEDADFDFPELSIEHLRRLLFGTYQIKQSKTYVEEHLDSNGNYIIELEGSGDDILRCTIRSRHSNAVKYNVWIQYALIGEPIRARYCKCKAGAWIIGCCVHVASIIWYLSFTRHNNFISSQGRHRIKQSIAESTIDSDDDISDNDWLI
jgi:hypothetical protein